MHECKKCSIIKAQKRRESSPDHYKKLDRFRYIRDKDRILGLQAIYRDSNRLYYSQKGKEFRNSEKGKESYKLYGKKRREKKHEMYDIEWRECKDYFNNQCAYCGLPIEEHYFPYKDELKLIDFHKEHVIDEGKNDIRNCVPSCNICNTQKNTKSLNNWYNPNNSNYTYERYYKIYQWIRYDHKKYILPKRRYKHQHMSSRLKEIEELKNKN